MPKTWKGLPKIDCSCAECGAEFQRWPSTIVRQKKLFCSRTCKDRFLGKAFQGTGSSKWNSVERTCEACGQTFYAQPNVIERRGAKYCSRACRRKRTFKTCERCGQQFEMNISQLAYNPARFCSRKCLGEWRSATFVGPNHPGWRGGPIPYPPGWVDTLKKAIRQRDNYTCQECGAAETNGRHHVHHIDYDKNNLDPRNLVTLCRSCHPKTNGRRGYWQQRLTVLMESREDVA